MPSALSESHHRYSIASYICSYFSFISNLLNELEVHGLSDGSVKVPKLPLQDQSLVLQFCNVREETPF